MRHIPDGVLRRLDDEPLAVADRVSEHVAQCESCRARRAQIAHDTELASALLAGPRSIVGVDEAWARIQRELDRPSSQSRHGRRAAAPALPRRRRLPSLSLRAGLAIAATGIVVAGTAAAATLTTIFSPTHLAPVSVSQRDLQAIAAFTGLGGQQPLSSPAGASALRFGTIAWSSGTQRTASSLAQASAQAGFPATLPSRLPAGVGAVQRIMVAPRVRARVSFNARATGLAGSSVTVTAGPAVLAEYTARGTGLPTLAVATMRRPTAQSDGASLSQIEAFLLGQPGVPPQLAEEIRLLGDLRTILPVPVPSGASVRSVQIDGWPGILLADASNAVAGVVWEDGHGLLHAVLGLLAAKDVINVAQQLG